RPARPSRARTGRAGLRDLPRRHLAADAAGAANDARRTRLDQRRRRDEAGAARSSRADDVQRRPRRSPPGFGRCELTRLRRALLRKNRNAADQKMMASPSSYPFAKIVSSVYGKQAENSDVSPALSVAVAVITSPGSSRKMPDSVAPNGMVPWPA